MSAFNYAGAERLVTILEGGFSNNPKDPGGATYRGITLRAFEDYRGRTCTIAELKALTDAEVSDFYHHLYWPSVLGDALPSGVDLMLFDGAVNVGRSRSVTFLQQALTLDDVDGDLGPATMKATLAVKDRAGLIADIAQARRTFYRGLPTYPTFGNGWIKRVTTVALTASAWSRKALAA